MLCRSRYRSCGSECCVSHGIVVADLNAVSLGHGTEVADLNAVSLSHGIQTPGQTVLALTLYIQAHDRFDITLL